MTSKKNIKTIEPDLEKVSFRKGKTDDLRFIREKTNEWLLDDEHLIARDFLVAEGPDGGVVGFGRIKKYQTCYELGTVGVLPEWRGRKVGKKIVETLIATFPSDEIWITTDLVDYFGGLGFQIVSTGPKELLEKISSTCRVKGRIGVRIMLLRREGAK